MTSDSFISAYRRFTSRRGAAANIYSDNGTNFVGANRLLQEKSKEEGEEFNTKIYNELLKVKTQWHFIPLSSPHFGLWEAGVISAKTHLKKCIGEATLTYEELQTLMCQIEGVLNSRPLCPLSNDQNDLETRTPDHFLIGTQIMAPPERNMLDINCNRLSRWKQVQKMQQQFWTRWSSEYLSRLQQRPK